MPEHAKNTPMVLERLDATQLTIHTVHQNLDEVCEALAPVLAHSDLLNTAHAQAFITSHLKHLECVAERMSACDLGYVCEQNDDINLRGKIAETGLDLDHKIHQIRDNIRNLDSNETLGIYGMAEKPPRARQALVAYAQQVIRLLRARPYQFSGEIGQIIDTRTMADILEQVLTPFQKLVDEMNKEMDDLQSALHKRNNAIDTWADIYQGVCQCLEGLFRLANKNIIADALSPSFRRTAEFNAYNKKDVDH